MEEHAAGITAKCLLRKSFQEVCAINWEVLSGWSWHKTAMHFADGSQCSQNDAWGGGFVAIQVDNK